MRSGSGSIPDPLRLSWAGACRAAILVAVVASCGDDDAATYDAGPPDAAPTADGAVEEVLYLVRLESADDYAQMQAQDTKIKYLNRVDGRAPPAPLDGDCQFQNTRVFPLHLQFIRRFEELGYIDSATYTELVLLEETRVWWGGALQRWPATPHPISNQPGIITYTIYQQNTADQNLTVAHIVEADQRMKGCAPFAQDVLVFLAAGAAQEAHALTIRDELAGQGVAVLLPGELID